MKQSSFDVPILFLVFNRPDTTQVVFDQIKKIKPKKLFVAADGPRIDISGEKEKCERVRSIVNQVDWECEVKTLFREHNLGCAKNNSSAISWFFENVEEGIILEDDCVPDLTFFDFCKLMLEKYRYEEKVMMVAGTNYLFNKVKTKEAYFFSKYYSVWGWATWKRAWDKFDFEMKDWRNSRKNKIKELKKIFRKKFLVNFWVENFDKVIEKKVDTWDIRWCYSCIFNNGLSVVSINNLVSNIGIGGTHIKNKSSIICMDIKPFELCSVRFPSRIIANNRLDKKNYKTLGIIRPYLFRVKHFIKTFLKKGLRIIQRFWVRCFF
jgi:hypothetical protein